MNVEQLVQDGVSGIATYTAQLVRALPRHGWDVTPFTARHSHAHVDAAMRAAGLGDVDAVVLPLPRPALYDAWHTVGAADPLRRIAPVDLVHAPSVAVPPVSDVPLVVTAHDAAPVTFPDTYTRRGRWFHRQGFAAAAKRARFVIAVSEFSADELAAHTPIPRDRMRVVPNGVVVEAVTPDDVARARGAHRASATARTCCGSAPCSPARTCGCWSRRSVVSVASGLPHALVLVGAQGWVDAGVGAGGDDASWLVMPGPIAAPELAAPVRRRRRVRAAEPARGLRVARARGDGPGHRGAAERHPRAARGGRRRGPITWRPPTSTAGARRWSTCSATPAARAAMAEPGRARAAELSWDRCAAATAAVYEDALR